jgi:drug/metabolite transporter (DMT)-like permease
VVNSSSHPRPSALTGIVTITLTLLGWSSIPLFLKSFTHEIDAWTANGWRYGFSALIWAPVILWAYSKGRFPKGLWIAAIVPSFFNTLGQIAFAVAPYYVDPGLMTFALRLQILFVTIGAAVLFASERRIVQTRGFILGLLMVFGGTMATIWLNPHGLGSGTTTGILLSIGSGLLYACYSLSVRQFMHGVNPLIAFAAISIYTAIGILIPMFILGKDHGADAWSLPSHRFVVLLASALIGIGLGHTFYYVSIARLGVAVSAGVIQLQPFIVSIASIFIFKEHLTPGQWTGGCIAIAGSAVILSVQHRLSRAASNGRCPACASDLSGLRELRCPECGRPLAPTDVASDIDDFSTLPLDADTAAAEALEDRSTI